MRNTTERNAFYKSMHVYEFNEEYIEKKWK